MDLKFNNSRKYISITVPSKTQTMSPHIKSIDDIVVLGINLSRFNKLTQFFICVAGVFVFYLIYGYLQVKNSYLFMVITLWSIRALKSFVQDIYKLLVYLQIWSFQYSSRRVPLKSKSASAEVTVSEFQYFKWGKDSKENLKKLKYEKNI